MYKKHQYYIYIITNPERTVLYTGVTNDLSQRLIEHWVNKGQPKTFAGKYYCYNLIYYEEFRYINDAIAREKEIAIEQIKAEGKPAEMAEKIAAGKVNKFLKENTLLAQAFVKDNAKSVAEYLKSTDADLKVTAFKRVALG